MTDIIGERGYMKCICQLQLCCTHQYKHCNNLGNINFLWQVPEIQTERKSDYDFRNVLKLKDEIGIYITKQMRSDYCTPFIKATKAKPKIVR